MVARWLKRWMDERKMRQEQQEAEEQRALNDRRSLAERRSEEESKILALDSEEAIRRFYEEVEAGTIELTYERTTDMRILDLLPEMARELFIEVSAVYIDSVLWGMYRKDFSIDYFPGYIYLGQPIETVALMMKYREDGVYYEDTSVDPTHVNLSVPAYRTIFHYYLWQILE